MEVEHRTLMIDSAWMRDRSGRIISKKVKVSHVASFHSD